MTVNENIFEIEHLTKAYYGNKALNDISFSVKRGEIMGLVGANGAGKSTFLRILFGSKVISDTGGYTGKILINGEEVHITRTQQAMKLGMGMVHQEFMLIPEMSVAENITMFKETTYGHHSSLSLINKKADVRRAQQFMEQIGFPIDVKKNTGSLSINARQFVEIAREISNPDLKILFLDEPTAVLNKKDCDKLLSLMRSLADQGKTIIFCSHRLHEIKDVCDHVVVLRDGRIAGDLRKQEIDVDRIARHMIGHDVTITQRQEKNQTDFSNQKRAILEFNNYSVNMPGDELKDLNLDIREGEVLGITSLSGGGKFALGYGLMQTYPHKGEVLLNGETITSHSARQVIKQGCFLLPEDRIGKGLLLEEGVKENMAFSAYHSGKRFRKPFLHFFSTKDRKEEESFCDEMVEKLQIKCSSSEQITRELSGGNQQKVCIARAIAMSPKVLFVCEPTRGVDIEAKEKVLELLLELNQRQNTTIVLVSSELQEMQRICDRIAILCEGRLSAVLSPDADEKDFALAYTGEMP